MSELERIQGELHCSYRNAWFRGHESPLYRLHPSALRVATPPGLGALAELNGQGGPNTDDLRQPKVLDVDGILIKDGGLTLMSDDDLERLEGVLETDIRKELRILRTELLSIHKAYAKTAEELSKLNDEIQGKPNSMTRIDPAWRSVLVSRQRELKNKQSDVRARLGLLRERVLGLRSIFYGERHSFLAFRQRSVTTTYNNPSSWLLLAAMQHHGVPTRLLDWSTSAGVAIYFAVKAFREVMTEKEKSVANWLESNPGEINDSIFANLKSPRLWILNPYRLARKSTGYNRIDDPSIRTDFDYFGRFHESPSWPHNGPMPVTIPWHSERLFAQRGAFTIHGRNTQPLEEQYSPLNVNPSAQSNSILAWVDLPPLAAIYAVKHIVQYFGLDDFNIFRGEDDLGQRVAQDGRTNKEKNGPYGGDGHAASS